ncbi:MAG: hypothetical protein ACRDQ5_22005 [Sciscionella sp.]
MTTRRDEPAVAVLDLRDDVRDDVHDVAHVEGSVVVLDHADKAEEHDHIYQALLGNPQVSGIICLAVDGGSADGTVILRPAPSLAPAEHAATLWIGHQHGIRWRPTETRVRSVRPAEPSGLRQLIDALTEPVVFDAVVKQVSTLPYSTASAGMALERASLPASELRRVEDEAVFGFTTMDVGRAPAQEGAHGTFRAAVRAVVRTDPAEDVLVPGAELAAARAHAFETLRAAEQQIMRLDHRSVPFTRDRPGQRAGVLVERALAAAREFHQKVTAQLLRIDGNLRGERVPDEIVTQLGVLPPVPAWPREIRDAVRDLVAAGLGRYRSVARLLAELETERITLEPQGSAGAIAELGTLEPRRGPAPVFEAWPPRPALLALAAVTGMLVSQGIAPGGFIPGLALAWFGAGLLLHARQPVATGELGFTAALGPAVVLWGGPALLASVVTTIAVGGSATPAPWNIGFTVLAVLAFAGTVAVSWPRAVLRWRRSLELDQLRAGVTRTNSLLNEVLLAEWRPSRQRTRLAEGLRHAAIGLTAIRDVLTGQVGLFAAPEQHANSGSTNGSGWVHDAAQDRDVYQEVRDVVVSDLVELTVAALRPCWPGIEASRTAEPAEYVHQTQRLLTTYREHIKRHGLLTPPPFANDRVHRVALAARLWAGSQVADALSRGVADEMTQLCHAGQLGAVSAMAGGAQLVRFAPAALRESVSGQAGHWPAIAWTGDTEIAGTLRLVPLRKGVFQ